MGKEPTPIIPRRGEDILEGLDGEFRVVLHHQDLAFDRVPQNRRDGLRFFFFGHRVGPQSSCRPGSGPGKPNFR